MMFRRTSFAQIFLTLPRRSQLAIATAAVGIITKYMGRKTVKKMENINLSLNVDKMLSEPPDWSCFYYSKQYREECSEYNRMLGAEYIQGICSGLENKMQECNRKLEKEIAMCKPYAMDGSAKLTDTRPWLT